MRYRAGTISSITFISLTMNNFWNHIDSVYVINLDSRSDRWENFLKASVGIIPREKLHRISGVVGRELSGYGNAPWFSERTGERSPSWGGAAGCALSHRKVLETARDRGDGYFVVFEDDVDFRPIPAAGELLGRFVEEKSLRRGIFYLGFHKMPLTGRRLVCENGAEIWQLPGVLALHAYMLHGESVDRLLSLLPTSENVWAWLARYRAIDTWCREYITMQAGMPVYGLIPQWVVQSSSHSDIGGVVTAGSPKEKRLRPHCCCGVAWLGHLVALPFTRMKSILNSRRTYRRAVQGGFPGKRKRKK